MKISDQKYSVWIWGIIIFIASMVLSSHFAIAQHSVAREWNEVLLDAIRKDFARPTVHARNLFHTSIGMYDAWSVYDEVAVPFLLGNTIGDYKCEFHSVAAPNDIQAARDEAISYAAFRLLKHRFENSPGKNETYDQIDNLFTQLGYDDAVISIDYSTGEPAALGNYIAKCIIDFGLQDNSNEANTYANKHYTPINEPLAPILPGNDNIVYPNRWQPLALEVFIDQSGNRVIPYFLGPEWGSVVPFSLSNDDLTIYSRNENEYWVYHDPGDPPYLDPSDVNALTSEYQWNFELVSIWSSQLDQSDGVMWDISPASIGNIAEFPSTIEGYSDFYNLLDGGDASRGRDMNPSTGQPYSPQIVPRADYARVLAEFWADGPDSETPPGHWFTLLNYVNDHPEVVKKFKGDGEVLDDLEWDVKAYLLMGGTMHDVAISAWGIKGWYDYIRPISAIRYMADQGQSSDPTAPSFNLEGIHLYDDLIELVSSGDPLAGDNGEHIGKIKLKAWKGPDYIENEATDQAGVDWILAENWWPYQRPTFITPPFAGYVSGHSTYSRAAAEVMTLLTGDPFFPGGIGEFVAPKNEFLVFEEGPSVDLVLQWATYRDASDQCSLSRIWGGIHPPADDIPGRIIGEEIGVEAFAFAENYFNGVVTGISDEIINLYSLQMKAYPNPLGSGDFITVELSKPGPKVLLEIFDFNGSNLFGKTFDGFDNKLRVKIDAGQLNSGMYLIKATGLHYELTQKVQIQ